MSPAEEGPATNRLGQESSPYLLAHAHNPVHWQPWGPAAFARAKAEGKLIFLSSGYHACHWCHVMERESFQNAEVAKLLNEHFVCIKLDREERPDVDLVYLTALNVMGQTGGWPLSMFLAADGRPIAGGTYWPADDREVDGQTVPGFLTVLKTVIDAHQQSSEDMQRTAVVRAEQTRRALAMDLSLTKPDRPSLKTVTAACESLLERYDAQHGGFGRPPQFVCPKFPRPPQLLLLLEELRRSPTEALRQAVHHTLTEMAQGGLYDQIGGGFHRYSTERTWTVPHFEKMLYDNAQLLEIYAAAYRDRPDPLYRRVLEQTAAFVTRELATADGVFMSSLDADSKGVEGRYYVLSDDEINQATPDPQDRAFVRVCLGLDGPCNFEDRFHIPVRRSAINDADRERWVRLRAQLFSARNQRQRPSIDTKVLTSWNGLMIAGLAATGEVLSDPAILAQAERAADFLLATVRTKDELFHVYAAAPGQEATPQISGNLDDYTHLVHGLLTLHRVVPKERWLSTARELTDEMLFRFQDLQAGSFYYTSAADDTLFIRLKDQHDGVMPSGNSQALLNFIRLQQLTGDSRYGDHAQRTLQAFASSLEADPAGLAGLCRVISQMETVAPADADIREPSPMKVK